MVCKEAVLAPTSSIKCLLGSSEDGVYNPMLCRAERKYQDRTSVSEGFVSLPPNLSQDG